MLIKQLSVFIENKKGRLAAVTGELKKAAIDIRAIAVFDTTEFGILRMVVDQPEKALDLLEAGGFVARVSAVLAVEPKDERGSLDEVLNVFDKYDINVEYVYSFVLRKRKMPLIIFKVDQQEKAIEVLEKENIKVVSKDEVYGQ